MTARERDCNDPALPREDGPTGASYGCDPDREAALAERVASGLAEHGWIAIDDALPPSLTAALASRARALDRSARLARAAIGRQDRRQHLDGVRGDRTAWLATAHGDAAETALLGRLGALRAALNASLFLGLAEIEAHFALYPPGARYAAHRDRFRDDDRRVISAVYYLNEAWREADGGALLLHLDPPRALAPNGGRAVYFRSDEVLHEVLPATRERLSVAAWFRRR